MEFMNWLWKNFIRTKWGKKLYLASALSTAILPIAALASGGPLIAPNSYYPTKLVSAQTTNAQDLKKENIEEKIKDETDGAQIIAGRFHSSPDTVQVGSQMCTPLPGSDIYQTPDPVSENPCTINVFKNGTIVQTATWTNEVTPAPDLYENGKSLFVYNLEDARTPGASRNLTITNSSGQRKTATWTSTGRPMAYSQFTLCADSSLNANLGNTLNDFFWSQHPNPERVYYKTFSTVVTDSFGPGAVSIRGGSPSTLDTSAVTWSFVKDKEYDFSGRVEKIDNSHFITVTTNDSLFGHSYNSKIVFEGLQAWNTTVAGDLEDRLFTTPIADTQQFSHTFQQGRYNVIDSTWSRTGELESVWQDSMDLGSSSIEGWDYPQSPEQPTNYLSKKKCKGGTSLSVDPITGRVDLIKGSSTEYWTHSQSGWTHQSTPLPGKAKEGSDIVNAVVVGTDSTYYYTNSSNGRGFYAYQNGTWQPREMPLLNGKYPNAGTSMDFDPSTGKIKMTVGGRKTPDKKAAILEYTPGLNTWALSATVPLSKGSFKEGAAIGFDQNGNGYATAGYTNEFLTCPTGTNNWIVDYSHSCPVGTHGKNKGDATVTTTGDVYQNPGDKSRQWSRFTTSTGWTSLADWPVNSSDNKLPKQEAFAYNATNGKIEAFTGNGTNNYWTYQTPSGPWVQPQAQSQPASTLEDKSQDPKSYIVSAYHPLQISKDFAGKSMEFYNVAGEKIYRTTINQNGEVQIPQDLAGGTYFTRIEGQEIGKTPVQCAASYKLVVSPTK